MESQSLLLKFEAEEERKVFMIDRRLINNQLVQYFNPKSNGSTKFMILQAMSNMLQFTDHEKTELGLIN